MRKRKIDAPVAAKHKPHVFFWPSIGWAVDSSISSDGKKHNISVDISVDSDSEIIQKLRKLLKTHVKKPQVEVKPNDKTWTTNLARLRREKEVSEPVHIDSASVFKSSSGPTPIVIDDKELIDDPEQDDVAEEHDDANDSDDSEYLSDEEPDNLEQVWKMSGAGLEEVT